MKCTCLIPLYNESQQILNVLEALTQSKEIDEILCVDDNSTDNSVELIESNFPEVKIIRRDRNGGKSEAVRTGLKNIDNDLTLLFDADIKDIKTEEIDKSIKMIKLGKADMIVLRRDYVPFNYFFPVDILVCGERVLRTDDLKEVFKKDFDGYAMELEINKYCLDNDYEMLYTLCSTKNTHKTKKWGLFEGIKREFRVYFKILIKDMGFFKYNMLKQYLELAHPKNYLHPILEHVDKSEINL